MHQLAENLRKYLCDKWSDCNAVTIEQFNELPGGWSKRTFSCDVHVERGNEKQVYPVILRMDTPEASAIFINSRSVEHILLNRLHDETDIRVPKSYFAEISPAHFGTPAMLIERLQGMALPVWLAQGGAVGEKEATDVARAICEKLAALHLGSVQQLNRDAMLNDPLRIGSTIESWDHYLNHLLDRTIKSYADSTYYADLLNYEAALHLRRNKPRPLPLAVVHGEVNPNNIIVNNGKVEGIIDWEMAHVGDPREDLGWLLVTDAVLGTKFLDKVNYPGGFIGYYNKLTGFDVTPAEVTWFQVVSFIGPGISVNDSTRRLIEGKHRDILPLYICQFGLATSMLLTQLLGYPTSKMS